LGRQRCSPNSKEALKIEPREAGGRGRRCGKGANRGTKESRRKMSPVGRGAQKNTCERSRKKGEGGGKKYPDNKAGGKSKVWNPAKQKGAI